MLKKGSKETRVKAARELARCHRYHLLQELKKSQELLANMTTEGVIFKEHTENQLGQLEEMFPGLDQEEPVETEEYSPNLMRDWYEAAGRVAGAPPYEDSSFKSMNVYFMDRIRYFLNPVEELRSTMIRYITDYFIVKQMIDRNHSFTYYTQMEVMMGRFIERRFRYLGFESMEVYSSIIDNMSGIMTEAFFRYANNIAEEARARSDTLLRNILPDTLADELRANKTPEPIQYESVTIVFTDFVGFSKTAGEMTATQLVEELGRHFNAYDTIIDKYGLEKLKTIGDSYMFAGGIPEVSQDHAVKCVQAALDIRDYMNQENRSGAKTWGIRIGVHTGPIVAGIIGHKKFSYDIWGNSVNIASRMESSGEPNSVNLSEQTYKIVKDQIKCSSIGVRSIKNCGEMHMYVADEIS